ncbi:hypothetical protein D3C75_1122300 [compost metagenome]
MDIASLFSVLFQRVQLAFQTASAHPLYNLFLEDEEHSYNWYETDDGHREHRSPVGGRFAIQEHFQSHRNGVFIR